jgi:hypothetical protein
MKTRKAYTGIWRITDMSTWEKDFIDLVAPGHILLKSDGTGTLAFGPIQADMDCRIENIGSSPFFPVKAERRNLHAPDPMARPSRI